MPFVPDKIDKPSGRFVPDEPVHDKAWADQQMEAIQPSIKPPPAKAESIGDMASDAGSYLLDQAQALPPTPIVEGAMEIPAALKAASGLGGKAGRALEDSGQMLGQGVSKLGKAFVPKIDPETAKIAKKAANMGIQVPLDMLTDNNVLKVFGRAMREIPLSGSPTSANRTAFNKSILKTIGADEKAEKVTPEVFSAAMNKHGKTIGDISARHDIVVDAALKKQVADHLAELSKETPDVAGVVKGYITDIQSRIKNDKIDGETFRKLRSQLTTQMRTTQNGDLRRALSQLDEEMLDAVQKNLSADELKQFNEARQYYANGKQIEPLVAKAAIKGQGDMSPAAYANAQVSNAARKAAVAKGKGGAPADVAQAGSKFLTEPSSSNTAEKGMIYKGLGGGLAAMHPAVAGGVYSLANLYNRFGPVIAKKLLENQP